MLTKSCGPGVSTDASRCAATVERDLLAKGGAQRCLGFPEEEVHDRVVLQKGLEPGALGGRGRPGSIERGQRRNRGHTGLLLGGGGRPA